jgi:SsrA-binding protein
MKIENRKAYYDYFIEKTYEAGIVLLGSEVKSIVQGRCNLKGSFARIVNNEVWMFNVHISNIDTVNFYERHEELRPRKLLLHKKEIKKLIEFLKFNNGTIIPLEIYQTKKLKVKIGLCIGKKIYDKRESIKERDLERKGKE